MIDAHGQMLLGLWQGARQVGLDAHRRINSALAIIADQPDAIARYLPASGLSKRQARALSSIRVIEGKGSWKLPKSPKRLLNRRAMGIRIIRHGRDVPQAGRRVHRCLALALAITGWAVRVP